MHEIRQEPIEESWILLSENRITRLKQPTDLCPFCPGKESLTPPEIMAIRDGGEPNSPNWKIRVIPNRYPAIGDPTGENYHEVVIETPDHGSDLALLDIEHLTLLLSVFRDRIKALYSKKNVKYVQLFKNHGEKAGASILHPHSQIIAIPFMPLRLKRELVYFLERDGLRREFNDPERIVAEEGGFIAFTPYGARFAFEVWIAPVERREDFTQTEDREFKDLARLLKKTLGALRAILNNPPYNLILHSLKEKGFHWHFEIIPRFEDIAGFEIATGAYINSVSPETAAEELRSKIKEGSG